MDTVDEVEIREGMTRLDREKKEEERTFFRRIVDFDRRAEGREFEKND